MKYTRVQIENTTEAQKNISKEIVEETCKEAYFFAAGDENVDSEHRLRNNLPLFVVILKKVDKGNTEYLLYDDCYLSAQRKPRFNEVKFILDTAVSLGKVRFCAEKVELTCDLPALKAVQTLLSKTTFNVFSNQTRPVFFGLLSAIPESEFEKL